MEYTWLFRRPQRRRHARPIGENIIIPILSAFAVALSLILQPASANEAAAKGMQEFMEFAHYEAGLIVPQQLSKYVFDSGIFIDTRDKKVILFCNTECLSAQAAFALRVAGRDNVLVLQTGIEGWKRDPADKP